MADISTEIAAFKNAVYGEDVRDAMVSLANKLNNESSDAIEDASNAYTRMDISTRSIYDNLFEDLVINKQIITSWKNTKGFWNTTTDAWTNNNVYIAFDKYIPINTNDVVYVKWPEELGSVFCNFYDSNKNLLGSKNATINTNVSIVATFENTSYVRIFFGYRSSYSNLSVYETPFPYVCINKIKQTSKDLIPLMNDKLEYITNNSDYINVMLDSNDGFYNGSLVYNDNSDWRYKIITDFMPESYIIYSGWGSQGAPGIIFLSGESFESATIIGTYAWRPSEGGEASYSGRIFTDYKIRIPSNTTIVLVQSQNSIPPIVNIRMSIITQNESSLIATVDNDVISWQYMCDGSLMKFIFGQRGPNLLPDFKQIFINTKMVYANTTDWFGPFIIYAKNNADGDDLSHETFTGGNHNYANSGDLNHSATGRNIKLQYYACGAEIINGSTVVTDSIDIIWTNSIQATNTKKEDGSGREVLEERHRIHITTKEIECYTEIIPYEDIIMTRYYGFQAGMINSYGDRVRFIGGSNKGYDTIANAPNSGNKKANMCIITNESNFDTGRFELELDTTLDCGRAEYLNNINTNMFISNSKAYTYLIANHDINANEIYAARAWYRWFNE